jgi:hypothetical protein
MSCNWIQRQFDASRFTGGGSMVWTVTGANVFTDAYVVEGKTVTYTVTVGGTTTSGTASSELRIALPTGMKVMRDVNTVCRLHDGTSASVGYLKVNPTMSYIRISNFDVTPLALGVFSVFGQITFEIE